MLAAPALQGDRCEISCQAGRFPSEIVWRGSCSIAGVGRSTRLDQQQMHLLLGKRLVLNAARHHEELARPQHDLAKVFRHYQFRKQ